MSLDHSSRPTITIDGTPLDPALVPLMELVEIDDHQHLPDRFQIVLSDPDGRSLNKSRARIGSVVRILGTARGERSESLLIHGEVTALEGAFTRGARVIIRGYDHSHRLVGFDRTETYQDVTDADIARTVAQRAGIEVGTIEETTITHEHVSQLDQPDWDFLKVRAREADCEVGVVDGKLEFKRRPQASTAPAPGDLTQRQPLELVWGTNLQEFYPRVTAADQVAEVEVRGWDAVNKQEVVGTARAETTAVEIEDRPADLAAVYGRDRWVATASPVRTQAAADEAARAEAERIAASHAEADGVAFGHPALKAGVPVSVGGVGRFSGRYVLTHTRHTFDDRGYTTSFQVTGQQDRSLLSLVGGAHAWRKTAGSERKVYGLVSAIVTNVDDPEQLCRVKVKFPWFDAGYESPWARVIQPGAGPESGVVFLPDVDDEVIVGFAFGDIRHPYVLGGVWNVADKPKLGDRLVDNGHVRRRGFVSRSGHMMVFFDDDSSQSGVALMSADNKLRISLNQSDAQLIMHSDGKITIRSTGDLKLDAGGNLTIEAGGSLQIKASGSGELNSSGTMTIKGATVNVN
jgi:phage protein D